MSLLPIAFACALALLLARSLRRDEVHGPRARPQVILLLDAPPARRSFGGCVKLRSTGGNRRLCELGQPSTMLLLRDTDDGDGCPRRNKEGAAARSLNPLPREDT
ncbi:hypothetical protein JCM30394_20230 [Deferrisoma palaeochoriense]